MHIPCNIIRCLSQNSNAGNKITNADFINIDEISIQKSKTIYTGVSDV